MQIPLRRMGLLLIECEPNGSVVRGLEGQQDWLADLLLRPALTQARLAETVARWNVEPEPSYVEIVDGVWALPMPLTNRRQRSGYLVVLAPTKPLLDAALLPGMCQAAELDQELCRTLLDRLPPVEPSEVPRIAALVRHMRSDQERVEESEATIVNVGQALAWSYEEITLLYTITRSMTIAERPERYVQIVCDELLATLPYRWIGVQLVDAPDRLKGLAGRMFLSSDAPPSLDVVRVFTEPILGCVDPEVRVFDTAAKDAGGSDFHLLGEEVVVKPLVRDDRAVGLLMIGNKEGDDPAASSVHTKILDTVAIHLCVFLENAALFDDLNIMFLGTLEALTASIDAKDRNTCGHSQRVAHLTRELAVAVGLDEFTVGRMRIAGLVHDVGKIGVPDRVLLKPGRLTDEEFGWIRRHPEIGYRILRDIPQLADVLPGVLYHHERWDGGGYPHGLKGEEIPLIARLICLADSFDAMSSTRTYRAARCRDEVIREIARCAGTQFDPELVPSFVDLDFTQYDALFEGQRRQDAGDAGEAA